MNIRCLNLWSRLQIHALYFITKAPEIAFIIITRCCLLPYISLQQTNGFISIRDAEYLWEKVVPIMTIENAVVPLFHLYECHHCAYCMNSTRSASSTFIYSAYILRLHNPGKVNMLYQGVHVLPKVKNSKSYPPKILNWVKWFPKSPKT